MPFVNVKLIEGVFDSAQKREIVERLTDTMVEIEGENMRGVTWVVVEEVKSGDWGIGGKPMTNRGRQSARGGSARVAMIGTGTAQHSRALEPAETGWVELRGVRVAYEVFGEGEDTLVLLPPWTIIHSRFWKAQIPYLSRHFRVVSFDARGNGRSDRPIRPEDYAVAVEAEHALAVLDHVGVERCVLVAHCGAAPVALLLGAEHPERVAGAVFMSPALPLTPPLPERTGHDFEAVLPEYEGWAKSNRHHWREDFRDYLEFFFSRCYTEPHSTKQIEDCVSWGLETSGETLALTIDAPDLEGDLRELLERLRCPLLVTQGDEDAIVPPDRGARVRGRHRRQAGRIRRRRALPTLPPPGPLQPDRPRVRRALLRLSPRARRVAARDAAPQARAADLLPDRARPRMARRRDRARAARARARARDRLARAGPRHARPRGVRRAHPPRQPAARQRVPPHRRASHTGTN